MQTFLPLPDFKASLECLDYKRLGKQRLEANQIINCLSGASSGWANHPAVKMWEGYGRAIIRYYDLCIDEWVSRGYNNTMEKFNIDKPFKYPWWFGDERFHASHRSNLLRKDPSFYSQFGWKEPNTLPYWWPTKWIEDLDS